MELAKKLNGEVVSADSMQIYEHMDIGTAKVTPEEMQGIPHHMVGCVSPFEEYSAARYVEDAAPLCEDILSRGKLPIIVGGTGLYIDSLLAGRTFAERGNAEVRERISGEYDTLGGLVFSHLTEIPADGERPVVECFGLRISVEEIAERRVEWAIVEKLSPEPETDEGEENN